MRYVFCLCLLLALAVPVPAGSPTSESESVPADDLRLRVSTHHGYIPLDLELTGKLPKIDPGAFKSCVIRVDRTYEGPSGITINERKEHPCVESPGDQASIPAAFVRNLMLEEPGDYSLRIVLEPLEGRPIAGMTHEVRVFRSKREMGLKTTEEK